MREVKNNKVRVLVVDDSALVRESLKEILNSDSRLQVMATAPDPYIAANRIAEEVPDVITLDLEMPRMNGLSFLKVLREQHPIPVVVCSSIPEESKHGPLEALELGAIDIIHKPRLACKQYLLESSEIICDAVFAASRVRAGRRAPLKAEPKLTADAVMAKAAAATVREATEKVVLLGASTGGTEALRVVLRNLPASCPGIVAVQHMPEKFTLAFAEQLNALCGIHVKEAQDNDPVLRGQALIAPGNRHCLLRRTDGRYHVEIKDGPLVSRHRPSVDVLFRSGAHAAGKNAFGVLMTGMGDDGARGLLEMRQAGGLTAAQDEATSIVYGMPQVAKKLGAAVKELALESISNAIVAFDDSSR